MLAQFLSELRLQPFQYGISDCATLMADWLMLLGYADAMADRRGGYATRLEYRLAIKSERGLKASCEARFGRLGLQPTSEPAAGDVALVWAPFAQRRGRILHAPTGALCVSARMRAVLTADLGIVIAPMRTLAAWKVA